MSHIRMTAAKYASSEASADESRVSLSAAFDSPFPGHEPTEVAKEILLRWNAHEDLLEACEALLSGKTTWEHARTCAESAIAKARGIDPKAVEAHWSSKAVLP